MHNEKNLSAEVVGKPKISKKQQACVNRYVAANYDRINVTFRKGEKELLRIAAAKVQKSVNAYIVEAVHEAMKKDNISIDMDGE